MRESRASARLRHPQHRLDPRLQHRARRPSVPGHGAVERPQPEGRARRRSGRCRSTTSAASSRRSALRSSSPTASASSTATSSRRTSSRTSSRLASASTSWWTSAWPTSASRAAGRAAHRARTSSSARSHYASPEQLSAAVVDARSDVYSLGAVVFEMLTGRVPYPGDDPFTVLNGHLNAPVPRPSSLRADLPAWMDVTVGRALAKSPDDRWTDIAEFGRALCARRRRPARPPASQVSPAGVGAPVHLRARASGSAPGAWAARCIAACTARWGTRWRSGSCGATATATGRGRARGSCARRRRSRSRTRRSSRSATTARSGGLVYLVTDSSTGQACVS